MRELPLASLESSRVHDHNIQLEISPEIRVKRTEIDGLGNLRESVHIYQNEPGRMEVYTHSLFYLQHEGQEYINKTATYIMELVWGKVAPGSGTAECATILGVTKSQIGNLSREGKMPEPITILAATPMWRTLDVVRFALSRPKVKK